MNAYTLNVRSIAAACFVVMIVMFASVALPHLAFAQDDDGDYGYSDDGCCDYGSVDTYSDDDYGSVDTYPDDYDYGSVDSYPDSYDYGSVDTYPDDYDYGSVDTYSDDDYGSVDTYPDTVYDSSTPEYTEDEYGTDEYGTDEYGYDEYGSEEYSTPSYANSTPEAISAPASYYSGGYGYSTPISAPIIPSAPIVQNVPIAYQQQPQQQVPTVINQQQPNVTTNTCTYNSCNTTTSVENSGNTTTVIPVAAAPVTYPVQYTFPTQPTYQNVSCTISASPNSIESGQYAYYLTWQSYGATSATLTNYGNVAPNGSLSVQPYGSMNYVLTVYGQNGQTATCNTYVSAATIAPPPSTPSVTLSQIPYTGFDFGTVGDAMYWAMLTLFALAAGYLLIYYKGGMGAFAGAVIPTRRSSQKSHKTVVSASAPNVETKAAPEPVVEKKIETPAVAVATEVPAAKTATFETLPAFSSVRPTSDSMSIANHDGAPRIVITRN